MLKKQSFEELCICWQSFLLCFSFKVCCCCCRCDDFLAKDKSSAYIFLPPYFPKFIHHILYFLLPIVPNCQDMLLPPWLLYYQKHFTHLVKSSSFFAIFIELVALVSKVAAEDYFGPVSFYLGSNFCSRKHVRLLVHYIKQ